MENPAQPANAALSSVHNSISRSYLAVQTIKSRQREKFGKLVKNGEPQRKRNMDELGTDRPSHYIVTVFAM